MSYRSRSEHTKELICRNVYYLSFSYGKITISGALLNSFKSVLLSFIVKRYANSRDILNSQNIVINYINLSKIHEISDAKSSYPYKEPIFVNSPAFARY